MVEFSLSIRQTNEQFMEAKQRRRFAGEKISVCWQNPPSRVLLY